MGKERFLIRVDPLVLEGRGLRCIFDSSGGGNETLSASQVRPDH